MKWWRILALARRHAIHDRLTWLAEHFPDAGFGPCRYSRTVCICSQIRHPDGPHDGTRYPDMAPRMPGWGQR